MLELFTDPIFRGPTIATMLMCAAQAIVGVFMLVSKKALLGEVLSHGTYPGVTLALMFAGVFIFQAPYFIFLGAFITAYLGVLAVRFLEIKGVQKDTSLCVCLALFFGIGTLFASYVQQTCAKLFRLIQVYLYGQAATMSDGHIYLYAAFFIIVAVMAFVLYRHFQLLFFDPTFAKSCGISLVFSEILYFILLTITVVLGLRCVGIMLISGTLIIPPMIARCFTNRLSVMLFLAPIVAAIMGFLGNFCSLKMYTLAMVYFPGVKVSFPTGPMIILAGCFLAIGAFLFAPTHGKIISLIQTLYLKITFKQEALLLRALENEKVKPNAWFEMLLCGQLCRKRLFVKQQGYRLTEQGKQQALFIQQMYALFAQKLDHEAKIPQGASPIFKHSVEAL